MQLAWIGQWIWAGLATGQRVGFSRNVGFFITIRVAPTWHRKIFHEAKGKNLSTGWWWLEPWKFLGFSSFPFRKRNFIIPTDELTPSFFRGIGRSTTNQMIINHHENHIITRLFLTIYIYIVYYQPMVGGSTMLFFNGWLYLWGKSTLVRWTLVGWTGFFGLAFRCLGDLSQMCGKIWTFCVEDVDKICGKMWINMDLLLINIGFFRWATLILVCFCSEPNPRFNDLPRRQDAFKLWWAKKDAEKVLAAWLIIDYVFLN